MLKNNDAVQAIREFFAQIDRLKELDVIRSDVLLGDIGEYLCSVAYSNFTGASSKTQKGIDGELDGQTVQIKFSNSPDAKNLDLGNPEKYQNLIVVLGPQSAHREDGIEGDFIFYRFSAQEVKEKFKVKKGYTLTKNKHFKEHDRIFPSSTCPP